MAIPAVRLTELMSDGSQNVAKLPVALISCGVTLTASALSLLIFRVPSGNTPVFLYYGTLTAIVIFGLVEASFGYWARPRDDRVGKAMLRFSILPHALVVALGGAVSLK